jgi:hypothetical protein
VSLPYARVQPKTPFVEVPYKLVSAWTAGGFTWEELLAAKGLPRIVAARMTKGNAAWCEKVVKLWPSFEAYAVATGEDGVKEGRAFLGPPRHGLPVSFLTGCANKPIVFGQRQKWRW